MRAFAATLSFALLALALASAGGAGCESTIQLTGTVGPGFTITLKNHTKTVKTLAPAKYTFVINDKSNIHNFHLIGPGVNKKTTVGGRGHHPIGRSPCAREPTTTSAIPIRQ